MKSRFEEMGGTCVQVGDYYIPDLKVSEHEETRPIGRWGGSPPILYTSAQTSSDSAALRACTGASVISGQWAVFNYGLHRLCVEVPISLRALASYGRASLRPLRGLRDEGIFRSNLSSDVFAKCFGFMGETPRFRSLK